MFDAIQFSSFNEFFTMGGYAFNVWSVYFLFGLFLFANLYFPVQKNKRIMKSLKRRILFSEQSKENLLDQPEVDLSVGENQ